MRLRMLSCKCELKNGLAYVKRMKFGGMCAEMRTHKPLFHTSIFFSSKSIHFYTYYSDIHRLIYTFAQHYLTFIFTFWRQIFTLCANAHTHTRRDCVCVREKKNERSNMRFFFSLSLSILWKRSSTGKAKLLTKLKWIPNDKYKNSFIL